MNNIGIFVAALGTLILLAGTAGAVWAVLRTSAQEATIKRLREENEDYLRRLNYLEPRVDVLENRNEVLEQLHNPAKAIADLAHEEHVNHDEVMGLLRQKAADILSILRKIDTHIEQHP